MTINYQIESKVKAPNGMEYPFEDWKIELQEFVRELMDKSDDVIKTCVPLYLDDHVTLESETESYKNNPFMTFRYAKSSHGEAVLLQEREGQWYLLQGHGQLRHEMSEAVKCDLLEMREGSDLHTAQFMFDNTSRQQIEEWQ